MPGPTSGQHEEFGGLRAVSGEGGAARARRASGKRSTAEPRPATAPLESLPAGRHNLPRELSSFVGRQAELAGLTELLETSPLVTLTGPSGIGKTRLALRVAAHMLPQVPGGVWMAELARLPATDDPQMVAEAVGAALDVRPEPGRPLIDGIIARLGHTPILLVLDNCEHLSDAAASVARELLDRWAGLTVLATSQRPLGINGEQVFALAPLSLPAASTSGSRSGSGRFAAGGGAASDAVALFHARAKAAQPGLVLTEEGAAAVAEICRRLDGVPLALELAAARTAVLSPTEIVEHLEEHFGLLARIGGSGTPRHQSLQSALDWSHDLLPASEKALLRRLSIFAGGASLAQVTDICTGGDVDAMSVVDLLSSLVSKSLVVAHTSDSRARYRLLETVRVYARNCLEEAGEGQQVAERHADWFAALAEQGWHDLVLSDLAGAAEALEQEHDNLRAGLKWLLANDRSGDAVGMASALSAFWKVHGHLREGTEWLDRALQASASGPPVAPDIQIRTLWGVGMLATLQGDLDRATTALEEALVLARGQSHKMAIVQLLNLLGFISVFTADPVAAIPLLEESVELARAEGDGFELISALALYGRARLFSGETADARDVFEECRRLGRLYDDEAGGLIGLGCVALAQGHHEEARELLELALPAVRLVDEQFEAALVLSLLGELAWLQGSDGEARPLLEEGLELARSMGAPYPACRCLLGLGQVAWTDGDLASAFAMAGEAVTTARQARLPYALVRCVHLQADLHRSTGGVKAARAGFEEALSLATGYADPAGMADAKRCLALLMRAEGDYRGATSMILDALELFVRCQDQRGVAASLEGLAGVAIAQERPAHAVRLMGAASAVRQLAGCARSPHDQGDHEQDDALAHAAMTAKEFKKAWTEGAALSLDEAVTLAGRSRGGRSRPDVGWAGLTSTEAQVGALAVGGLTNNEIAERMFVSPRTVQGHMSRVFAKLGVSSRRELRNLAATADK